MSALVFYIDPGFAFLGYGSAVLHEASEEVVSLGVIQTEKSDKKREVLASQDNVRRAEELYDELSYAVTLAEARVSQRNATAHKRVKPSIQAFCMEAKSFPRNASAAAKISMAIGVSIAVARQRNVPIIQASPQEIKLAVCRKKDASKKEVEDAMIARYPGIDKMLTGLAPTKRNHAYDSLASMVACLNNSTIRVLRNS